jgi:hypothetical protein
MRRKPADFAACHPAELRHIAPQFGLFGTKTEQQSANFAVNSSGGFAR